MRTAVAKESVAAVNGARVISAKIMQMSAKVAVKGRMIVSAKNSSRGVVNALVATLMHIRSAANIPARCQTESIQKQS